MQIEPKILNSDLHFDFCGFKTLLKSKKSQVAVFVILAIAIVAIILLIIFLWGLPDTGDDYPVNPATYIDSCIRDSVKEAISNILENGGYIEQRNNSISYKGKKYTYLCYNANYYDSCINQQPMLIEHIEQEITEYIEPEVKDCFSSLQGELEDKGYEVSMGTMELETNLQPRAAVITTNRELTISKGEETQSLDSFKTVLSTPLYKLAGIASEIVNDEASYCDFNNLVYMLLHPEYDIRKKVVDDSNLYTLKSLESGDEFKFAIRGCVMPPGI
jgi:hypothetical protein